MDEIRKMREALGLSRKDFAALFGMPAHLIRDWEQGYRNPKPYIIEMMKRVIEGQNPNVAKIKEAVKKDIRYEGFTFLAHPETFKNLYSGLNIPYVQVHDASIFHRDDNDFIIGFSGMFSWKKDKITSLDGDSYNDEMTVIAYEWFKSNGKMGLDILCLNW